LTNLYSSINKRSSLTSFEEPHQKADNFVKKNAIARETGDEKIQACRPSFQHRRHHEKLHSLETITNEYTAHAHTEWFDGKIEDDGFESKTETEGPGEVFHSSTSNPA
jgi:hypothetical protein